MIPIMNEVSYVEDLLTTGNIGESPVYDATLVYRYYYNIEGLRGKALVYKVYKFFSIVYPKYTENKWHEIVSGIASKEKKQIHKVDQLLFYKDEMNTIGMLKGRVVKEIAFTLLALAKMNNAKNKNNNNWVNCAPKDVFKLAGIVETQENQALTYRQLMLSGFITISKKITNLNVCVVPLQEDGEIVYNLTSFKSLGYEYLNYIGVNRYIRCKTCNTLTRKGKHGTKLYCSDCAKASSPKIKWITCVDCGADVVVVGRNIKTCRCTECQKKETSRQNKIKYNSRVRRNSVDTPGIATA